MLVGAFGWFAAKSVGMGGSIVVAYLFDGFFQLIKELNSSHLDPKR